MKQLKDCLHLYLGCEVEFLFVTIVGKREQRIGKLISISIDGTVPEIVVHCHGYHRVRMDSVKPILRPLSDITEEECEEYNKLSGTMYSLNKQQDQMMTEAGVVKYLLSKHFDLFDLIHSGLALDATTTKDERSVATTDQTKL